ncbi:MULTISPECIES: hypothetical protein [Nonlabens]|uniref:hypothetical protein n=1 Tax=Nonlabens TaxID=363408 RepID=UPI000D4BBF55|nr:MULTISPECIES: hypothetical protein [Nonlabens]PQJ18433.1 hypothetical protein BST93_08070 [Nonlabens tegetincola]
MKYTTYILLGLLLMLTGCSEDTIEINGKGIIKGRVVEDITFLPLENVKISTNPQTNVVFTDVDGNFEIEVEEGQYAVQAQKDDFLASFESADVFTGETVELVYELKPSTANNQPPATPSLVAPVDNAVDQPFELTLEWSSVDPDEDELKFTVLLRNSRDNTVETFEDITEETLDVQVAFNTTYFWQVIANDEINTPVNSPVFTFSTADFPLNRFHFVRKSGSNNQIFSADGDGVEIALTDATTNSWRPRINRTANKIAFLRNVGAQIHVFTMDPDGNNQQQITSQIPVSGFNPDEIDITWSDDGSLIYYPVQDRLYSIQLDGTGLTQVHQTTGNLITEVDFNNGILAVKTNNLSGYNCEIYTIDTVGNVLDVVLTGVTGAVGGIDLSADNSQILYTRDASGFENQQYRRLDVNAYVYNFNTMNEVNVSFNKDPGTNDLDVRFSPTEASIIVYNQDNDGITPGKVQTLAILVPDTREDEFTNAMMPDWK